MKKGLIIVAFCILATVIYLGVRNVTEGLFKSNCIYTAEHIAVPQKYVAETFVIAGEAMSAPIDESYGCVDAFSKTSLSLLGPIVLNNITIPKSDLAQAISRGTKLRLVDVVALTKHGISTVDSGPGPYYNLILQDVSGVMYTITPAELGINEKELFVKVQSTGSWLRPQDFEDPR